MLDSLSLWLHETPLGETLLTMLISMLPVVELRGGLPAGVAMWPWASRRCRSICSASCAI